MRMVLQLRVGFGGLDAAIAGHAPATAAEDMSDFSVSAWIMWPAGGRRRAEVSDSSCFRVEKSSPIQSRATRCRDALRTPKPRPATWPRR
jgi:hypothetical protein